jgi:hypothetical protein|nr:MAG TPA: hypothetical protein [Caudoviricetes sp.]
MLLTNNNDFILTIDGVKFSLKLTFKVLERIYNIINDSDLHSMFGLKAESPFDLIENIESKENIIALIYCYADGKIDKEYIEETINNLSEIEYAGIKEIIKAATLSSIISTEDTKETKKEETKEEETFDDYYNYLYLSAITQLNFSKEQFYNSTPSEVKQLLNNNLLHRKTALIRTYIDIVKARNNSNENHASKDTTIKVADANEFFAMI